MNFLVVGPGALGCLTATTLARAAHTGKSVSLLDYSFKRAEILNSQGLRFVDDKGEKRIRLPVYSDPLQVKDVDVIFLCVKSYDLLETLKFCRPILTSKAVLIFLQNGIAHLDYGRLCGEAGVAFGTTTEGATTLGPGHIRHAGSGMTYLGFQEQAAKNHLELLENTASHLNHGGMQTRQTPEIHTKIWGKLFINVAINGLTVVYDCRNGELLNNGEALEKMARAVAEAEKVASKSGIQSDSPLQSAHAVCRSTAANVSSMLQDIRNKRRTEIAAINGAIVDLGVKYGIATPENSMLVRQIREIEEKNERK